MKLHYSLSMGKFTLLAAVAFLSLTIPLVSHAGDEDKKTEKVQAPPQEPEPLPMPAEPEAPDMSLGEDPAEVGPEFTDSAAPAKPKRRARAREPFDPDKNINYSELTGLAEPASASRGVLPPALGARGYRPNLVAVSIGERTPGYGGFLEYSWNRMAVGAFFAWRPLRDVDKYNYYETLGGIYGSYRWLPWDFSPYLLGGLELGSKTREAIGGLLGLGMEVRVYSGWTVLLGYTYHSTVRKGFWGGSFGWSF